MTHSYATAATQYIRAGATRYAYRRRGGEAGVPLILLQNFRQGMEGTDPLLLDGFAEDRPVIILTMAASQAPVAKHQTPSSTRSCS